ncbi:bifunctional 2-keto-4-hydroxyglutarate aldolase/2-keto-3-deoxy-6-phosphogluconate aldolase [Companilactobacillus sp. FL22-1]|uniref:bifunctional 2-keto-4-hydroxyglutarate aldolase/2-keto-3-deoxy-6-phosphogluconate aldolase n=1 Tax=Companilactobacillus sp. FL22-1 TaxID=3373892 RepID=UPI0037549FD3
MTLLKFDSLKKIQENGVVAVVRGYNEENSYKISKACIDGGVTAIELAFTSPNADVTIKRLSDEYIANEAVVVGAGTVLDAPTARIAIIAGARFIVSPSFNAETAKVCNLYNVPYVPGCFTPTEIQQALTYGADLIKVFPGSIAGKGIIKEVQGPFPNINIMPSGGVSLDNMKEWFASGSFVVGVGGSLVGPGKDDNYEQVKNNAEAFHNEFEKINDKELLV